MIASEKAEIYRVRWATGVETYYVPGPDAQDRRKRDLGPPRGMRERRG